MTTKYTDAPRTRVMTPAALNNGVHENHSIGQTMAIAPKKGLFDDISIPQIIAGAAAAATSVALASKIGIAGSVIGAAVSSVITVVSSQVYRHFISASAEAIKGPHAAVDYPPAPTEPVEFNAEEHPGGAATTQEMRQIAGRATTARVAPDNLRAKAAAERSQTQRRSSSSRSPSPSSRSSPAPAPSLSPPPVRVSERPEPILRPHDGKRCANGNTQSQDQQAQTDGTQDSSTSTDSSSNTQNQSQGADSSVNNSGAQSGTTDSSQTTDGSQPSTGRPDERHHVGNGLSRQQQAPTARNSSSGTASGTASTTRAKARHRATKPHLPLIDNRPVQRARIESGSRPFALGAAIANYAMVRCFTCKEEICHEQDNS